MHGTPSSSSVRRPPDLPICGKALNRSLPRPIRPRSWDGLATTSITGPSATVVAPGAAPTTATTTAGVVGVSAVSAGADGHGEPLHHRPVLVASRVHAIIGGEVQADHVSSHGRILASQAVGFVQGVGLVFAVVDAHGAGVTRCCLV